MKTNTSIFTSSYPYLVLSLRLTVPPYLPSNEFTAPIYCCSSFPLCATDWQWVAIQYQSVPRALLPTSGHGELTVLRLSRSQAHDKSSQGATYTPVPGVGLWNYKGHNPTRPWSGDRVARDEEIWSLFDNYVLYHAIF